MEGGRCRPAIGDELTANPSGAGGRRLAWPANAVETAVLLDVLFDSYAVGFGDIGLGGGTAADFGIEWPICSKWERNEDTGF
jgi:hypothetical protein